VVVAVLTDLGFTFPGLFRTDFGRERSKRFGNNPKLGFKGTKGLNIGVWPPLLLENPGGEKEPFGPRF